MQGPGQSSEKSDQDKLLEQFDPLSDKGLSEKEVKATSSQLPATNVTVKDWGESLHEATISGNRIVVTKNLICEFPKSAKLASLIPPFPEKKSSVTTHQPDPFADLLTGSDDEVSLDSLGSFPTVRSWFAIGFEGISAPKAHWRQYIYRTATLTTHTGGSPSILIGDIPLLNMIGMPLVFTNPTKPVRILDPGPATQPYYDMHPKTAKVREGRRVVLLDHPGGVFDELYEAAARERLASSEKMLTGSEDVIKYLQQLHLSAGCRIESSAHFDTYLCLDDKLNPIYHVALTVVWEFECRAITGSDSFLNVHPVLTAIKHIFKLGEEVSSKPDYWGA